MYTCITKDICESSFFFCARARAMLCTCTFCSWPRYNLNISQRASHYNDRSDTSRVQHLPQQQNWTSGPLYLCRGSTLFLDRQRLGGPSSLLSMHRHIPQLWTFHMSIEILTCSCLERCPDALCFRASKNTMFMWIVYQIWYFLVKSGQIVF